MPPQRLRISVALLAAFAALVVVTFTRVQRTSPDAPVVAPPPAAGSAAKLPPQPPGPTAPPATSTAAAGLAATATASVESSGDAAPRDRALVHAVAFNDWLEVWRHADPASEVGRALAAQGVELARARRAALKELIPADPQLALQLALPFSDRVGLPAEVTAQLERRIDDRGQLEANIVCFGAVTRIARNVLVGGESFETHVFGRRAQQHTKLGVPLHGIALDALFALSDAPLRVLDAAEKTARQFSRDALVVAVGGEFRTLSGPAELDRLSRELIAAESREGPYVSAVANAGGSSAPGGTTEAPPTAATTPWILGAKRVLWVRVDFVDDPGAPAEESAIAATNTQVSEFYAATSQGKTTFSFVILPATLRLPREKAFYNASGSTVGQLQADAAVLAKAYDAANGGTGAYDPDRFDRWIVLFKRMPSYVFGGQAQLTGPQVRMNGGISPGTTAHELGHTQGLLHAHYWLPSGTSGSGPGAHVEYGDVFDNMGSSGSSPNNHFNAPQKLKLGYLDATTTRTITESGTYRLARHDHADAAGIRGLKIAPADLGYDYWLEHRRFGPTAFGTAQNDRLRNGVLLHWAAGRTPAFTTGGGSYLIDATPGSAGGAADAPLRIGETFVDPDAGITIKPLAVGGTAPTEFIDVQVGIGAIDGNRNPVITAALPAGPLRARTNLIFTASATDPDNDPVYFRWDFGDRQLNPNLNNITRRFNKGGTYPLRVSAHDGKGGVAARTLNVEVVDPLLSWTPRANGLTTGFLGDVIFANGKFIAVGDNTILSSADGTTWSRVPIAATGYILRGVAHSGARFVTVGIRAGGGTERGGAFYSNDGVTWTAATMPTGTGQLLAVAYGAGRFVAVGELGRIYTSTDGATWTAASSGVTSTIRGVTYASGMFAANSDSGRVLTSPDGTTWTIRALPSAATVFGVTYYNGLWHAATGTTVFYTSPDAITWTRVTTTAGTGALPNLFRVISGLLVGTLSTNGGIAFAENAQAWSTVQLETTANTNITGIAEGNGALVAVGSRGLVCSTTTPPLPAPALPPPSLRNEADSIKVAVGKKNVLAATGTGFVKLELYANGTKVSELDATSGALSWTPSTLGNYSLVVRGIDATGASVTSAPIPAVSGFANWVTTNLKPASADLRGAVRVGNKWWIVGNSGSFFTLDDSGTLTPVDFATTQHLTSITHGKGRFVVSAPFTDAGAREEIGCIWTSADGYAWTPVLTTVFDNFNLNFVAFGQDKWVAGSTGGQILTSTDAFTWARPVSGVTNSLRRGVFGNNTWVVVGNGGRILTSPDATTWTTRTSGVTTDLTFVTFDNGTFVAVGLAGVILSSTDGVTWTPRTSGVTGILNSVARVKDTWVAVGDTAGVLTSSNLTTWTPASLGGNTITSLFVAEGGNGGLLLGSRGQVFTSTDPSTWRRLSQGTNDSRFGVVHAAGRFVAVGATTDPFRAASIVPIQYSTDGLTWTRAAAGPAFTSLNAITHGQGLFVAVGPNSGIYTSADGANWTARTLNLPATLVTVTAGPDAFVAASSGQAIYSSADGITWGQRLNGVGVALRGSAYGNGRYVVVGDSGTIRHSENGTNWFIGTSGVTANLQAVAYFEGVGFLAVGASGTMLNSLDGLTWSQIETGITDTIGAIARTPIGFVAAGGANGTLLVSLDGANWSVATLPADRTIRGLAASSSAIVAVGDNGTSLTFEFTDTTPPPSITTPPLAQYSVVGGSATFTVDAQNAVGAVYQWFKDGAAIAGATSPTYSIPVVAATHTGNYTVTVTSATGTVRSEPAPLSLGVVSDPGRLINLSIRADLVSASDDFTFGVVIGGGGTSGSKALVVRAVGPSLGAFGVAGALEDPKLEFFTGTTKVGDNDNWGGGDALRNVIAQVGAFPFSGPASRDAAIYFPSLGSGPNSAKIAGTGRGNVLAELYDATPAAQFTATTPRLVNVSVLKHLGTGVTAGFVIGGSTSRSVLIRAIGPALASNFGLGDAVADPQLALFSTTGRVGGNDNWGGTPALSTAFSQVGAFALAPSSRDAALLVTLQPGNYTVEVSGIGGSGTALIEVYEGP